MKINSKDDLLVRLDKQHNDLISRIDELDRLIACALHEWGTTAKDKGTKDSIPKDLTVTSTVTTSATSISTSTTEF